MLRANLESGTQALNPVSRRPTDVDDCDVDLVAAHFYQEIVGVTALGDGLTACLSEQTAQALPQEDAVLCNRYAHGSSAFTRVPPPAGVQTRNRPPSASTRSASPRRPVPRSVSAPPTPSSTISTTIWPSLRRTSTVAELACACFPMFAMLSETT